MNYFESDCYIYKKSELYCDGVPLSDIVTAAGSPVFIYSKKYFVEQYNLIRNAFSGINHKIFFSAKSNYNINVINIFKSLGASVDVNSEGELFRALKAGVDPKKIIFSGVGKTEDEIINAIQTGVYSIKVESEEELIIINNAAQKLGRVVNVTLRVNPDVDAETHPYISTGLSENKFGLENAAVTQLIKNKSSFKNVTISGLAMHIGSQILSVHPYKEAVEKLADLFLYLKSQRIELKHFNIGGGMGVRYHDEEPLNMKKLAEAISPILKKLNAEIYFEPGRFLTANAGCLVTKLLYNKTNGDKKFFIVDAGMNDLIRPSIYGSYHHIQPLKKNTGRKNIVVDVVGPVCESGDFFAHDRTLTEMKSGEYIAVMSAGAYSMTMSSNYNARRRPPEVVVDGDKFFIARGRESFEYLLHDEKIISELVRNS
ncbi:MAG: diaminopimelate decarboxylase [Ignavibacteriales bacterium]|nr:MAG: diaminopimelate decarboxylase [Ignavibacteriales bacterium]